MTPVVREVASVLLSVAVLTVAALAGSASSLPLGKYELFEYDPVANASSVVVVDRARFTVLTERVSGLLSSGGQRRLALCLHIPRPATHVRAGLHSLPLPTPPDHLPS